MPITLAITGRPSIVVDENEVSLGSAPHCTVAFSNHPEIQPKHAVIRLVAGRWLVEARDGSGVYLADGVPKRLQWLKPGDVIRLVPDGPAVTFQPAEVAPTPSPSPITPPPPAPSSATISAPSDSEEYVGLKLADEPGFPLAMPPVKVEEPEEIGAVDLFRTDIADQDESPRLPPPLPVASESPKPIMLQRISFESQLPGPEIDDTDQPPRNEIDPEVEWIIKIIVRIGGIGLAVLLIWLVFRELTM